MSAVQFRPWPCKKPCDAGLLRLGELYETRSGSENAVEHYNSFVELWQNADRVLQPQVRDVRERIAMLVGEGR